MQIDQLFILKSKKQPGFTLVEVMVVVFIISVLAAIAYPSYQGFTQKARRTEAMTTLTEAAARQENFYANNLRYAATMTTLLPSFGADPYITPDGNYNVGTTSAYLITATAQGQQFQDLQCRTFTLDSTGGKGATDSLGGTTTTTCWK